MTTKPTTHALREMQKNERRIFECSHSFDKNVHVIATREGGKVSTARAWLVPQLGKPTPCVIVTCVEPFSKIRRAYSE